MAHTTFRWEWQFCVLYSLKIYNAQKRFERNSNHHKTLKFLLLSRRFLPVPPFLSACLTGCCQLLPPLSPQIILVDLSWSVMLFNYFIFSCLWLIGFVFFLIVINWIFLFLIYLIFLCRWWDLEMIIVVT